MGGYAKTWVFLLVSAIVQRFWEKGKEQEVYTILKKQQDTPPARPCNPGLVFLTFRFFLFYHERCTKI